ncbi:ATP-dependent nuclease [Enterobacter mori]|uniref:ATP-dependent nuclease n=1 Tax=Enterobacter mori TaxID=539813 RepID=UPI002DBD5192|nr:AAA family ATPase [Enterobacter mori]MEB7567293.1 ATP-binding protein [Enterobacter mori]
MPVSISKIEIFNFRSIQKMSIDCSRLQLFVGNNDAGKSNILRALNLFFNGVTNPDEEFNFLTDYNIHSYSTAITSKKAREIKICLTLQIPESYKKTNGDYIEWTKTWRLHKGYNETIIGVKNVNGPRGGKTIQKNPMPARSNLRVLLNNINYIYIPAIKDKEYLSKLRSEIYGVVNEAFSENFTKSSHDFEESIAENLQELTDDISGSLGFQSKLSLPKDLSHLFEKLDFLNENSISLNDRGDGVKARHIPLILKFIAEKKKGLQAQGNPPYTFIWGYEEPENNLEITNAIKLADQFTNMLHNPISQLFLTTHSPAFYNLAKQNSVGTGCYYIEKDANDSTYCEVNLENLDAKMGVLELLSPHIESLKKELQNIQEVWELGKDKPVVYVEGPSDAIVLRKAILHHTPSIIDKIDIITLDFGGGTNYVCDMLTAYYHMRKHHQNRHRAFGIVDPDGDGKDCRAAISKLLENSKQNGKPSIRCVLMKLSADILTARKDGFNIPGVLEDNYPISIWVDEKNKGKLQDRNLKEVLSDDHYNTLASSNKTIDDLLDGKPYSLKVKYKTDPLRKVQLANKVNALGDDTAAEDLKFLTPCIDEMIKFLELK